MRNRLIELIKYKRHSETSELADYLLENDVIVPPCKIGDKVWAICNRGGVKRPQESIVSDMYFTKNMEIVIVARYVARGIWGKTVFLTEEEAERALRKEDDWK